MATINGNNQEKIFSLKAFLGLNEAMDGDAKLKLGEASEMLNWQVTREGSLKRRPGNETLFGLCVGYTESLGEEQEISKEETLELNSSVAFTDGVPEVGGTTAEISASDAGDYTDWYWEETPQRVWKITGNDGAWKGKRVHAQPSSSAPVRCLWSGLVKGKAELLAACANRLYRLYDESTDSYIREAVGAINTTGHVHIFGFNGNAYILDGTEYRVYDGTTLSTVAGYRPLIAIAIEPNGAFETAEQINKLTGERRGWLSPDGKESTFQLPESGVQSIDYIKDLKTGEIVSTSEYSYNLTAGTVTFNNPLPQTVNSYEAGWTMAQAFRSEIIHMRYSELYSGSQDNRVFLYGDGSAEALYTGLDYDGQPRADYFPDLGEVRVGDENTPITGMIRHYGSLICYKTDSAWSLQFGITTLSDSSMVPAFYVTPINKQTGNIAPGQVQLVSSAPVTLFGKDVYQWRNSSYYNSNLTSDERQAQRISDRIRSTLSGFDLKRCTCYDDNYNQNYYICYGDEALVFHYAGDVWSHYDGIGAVCMTALNGDVFFGRSDGRVERMSENIPTADGDPISCYWESGSTDFGQEYTRKHSAALWVALKPTAGSSVTVTVQTDRKETFAEKVVDADKVRNPGTREPYLKKLKLKAKKFLYYKLMFLNDGEDNSPTVVGADIRVRMTGYAK